MKNNKLQPFTNAKLINFIHTSFEKEEEISFVSKEIDSEIIQFLQDPEHFQDSLRAISVILSPEQAGKLYNFEFIQFLISQFDCQDLEYQKIVLTIFCNIYLHVNCSDDEVLQISAILAKFIENEMITDVIKKSLKFLNRFLDKFPDKIDIFLTPPSPIILSFQLLQNFLDGIGALDKSDFPPGFFESSGAILKDQNDLTSSVHKYLFEVIKRYFLLIKFSSSFNIEESIFPLIFSFLSSLSLEDPCIPYIINSLSAAIDSNYEIIQPFLNLDLIHQIFKFALSNTSKLRISALTFIAYICDEHPENCEQLINDLPDILGIILQNTQNSYERTLCCEIIRVIAKNIPENAIQLLPTPILQMINQLVDIGQFSEAIDAIHVFVTYFQNGIFQPIFDCYPNILVQFLQYFSSFDVNQLNILLDILLQTIDQYGLEIIDKDSLLDQIEPLLESDDDNIIQKARQIIELYNHE